MKEHSSAFVAPARLSQNPRRSLFALCSARFQRAELELKSPQDAGVTNGNDGLFRVLGQSPASPPAPELELESLRNRMLGYAQLFLRKGFSALVPDSRAHGASEGRFATYGYLEADDIHRWVSFLLEKQKATEVYALGESMGAAILLSSLQIETRFKAVVAESSFSNFKQIAKERMGNMQERSEKIRKNSNVASFIFFIVEQSHSGRRNRLS